MVNKQEQPAPEKPKICPHNTYGWYITWCPGASNLTSKFLTSSPDYSARPGECMKTVFFWKVDGSGKMLLHLRRKK